MFFLAPHQQMMIIINCLVLVLGAPGNILVIQVYLTKQNKTNTHVLIMCLALSDLISLCITFVLEVISWCREYEEYNQAFCRLLSFCHDYFAQCSVLITVCIAIDRYNAVCRPHQWKITTGGAQAVVGSCLLLSAVTSIAGVFSHELKTLDVPGKSVYHVGADDNVTISFCYRDISSGFNRVVYITHFVWFLLLFMILIVAYLRIYLSIRKRVAAGVLPTSEPDTSRLRVVRPVIRFVSHLTVAATNKMGSVTIDSREQDSRNDVALHEGHDLATRSTDLSSPSACADKIPAEKENHSIAGAIITLNSLPILPSIKPVQDDNRPPEATAAAPSAAPSAALSAAPSAAPSDAPSAAPSATPSATPRVTKKNTARLRTTAWNRIKPTGILEHRAPQVEETGEATDVKSPSGTDVNTSGIKQGVLSGPFAKAAQKRAAAATALNLKIQKTTTNMLLVAAISVIVTWLPTIIIEACVPNVHERIVSSPFWLDVILCLMGWLFLFNYVTNPFVYSLMNGRFRRDCVKSFNKGKKYCCRRYR